MKRILAVFMALAMFVLVGCQQTETLTITDQADTGNGAVQPENPSSAEEDAEELNAVFELAQGEYYFSSGAGGWGTELELDDDGDFDGEYHDSEMGDFADEYPDGTVYFCDFEGRFEVVEKLNDYSYSLSIEDLDLENEPETEEIRDEIRYVYAEPYGLMGSEFVLYSPETPVSELSEECLMWYMARGELDEDGTLGTWCIYDVENQTAFYIYE